MTIKSVDGYFINHDEGHDMSDLDRMCPFFVRGQMFMGSILKWTRMTRFMVYVLCLL